MKIPETLQKRLREHKIIPFVGAGASMPVRDNVTGDYLLPCWRDLLESAAQCLEGDNKNADADLVRSYLKISPPKYLEAASHARDRLGAVWYGLLDKQINIPYGRVDENSLRLAKSIWELGSRLVITTNYDRVLRWASPEQPDLQELDIESPAEQVAILRDGMKRPTLWHLHGRISKATELILTLESYKRLYPDAGQANHRYKAALHTLRSLLTSHSFLFIGFSLDDAHFGLQLLDIHEVFEGANGPHFILAREADRDRIKSLNRHVEVVTFPDFDDLPELVEELGAFAQQAAQPIDTSKPTGRD
ncbi:MAG: SIR2 family NAD-dependent protein deacylase [Blastocatellia bacterium]